MISMTYGELPKYSVYLRQFKAVVRDDAFQMHLKGSDADCADAHAGREYSDGNSTYEADELWRIIKDLTEAFHDGADCAGDLASSILGVLDFEWI